MLGDVYKTEIYRLAGISIKMEKSFQYNQETTMPVASDKRQRQPTGLQCFGCHLIQYIEKAPRAWILLEMGFDPALVANFKIGQYQ